MATKAPLTLFTLDAYRLIIAEDLDFADDCIRQLIEDSQTSPFFGFDIELKTSGAVRLIQLASRNCVYVFEIDKLGGIPGSLSSFLSNQAYVKMGVGVIGDAKSLMCSDKVRLEGAGELSRLHRMFDVTGARKGLSFSDCVALETLCELWLGKGLDKTLRDAREWDGFLTDNHYAYAATDAAVAVAIYQRMIEVPLLKNARRTLWVFVEYDTLNKLAVGLVDYPPHAAMSMRLIDTMEGTLKKMKQTLEHANEALSDDGTSWTEKMMPETVELCDTMTQAFDLYYHKVAGRR